MKKFQTKAIHVGGKPDPVTGAVAPSIVTSTVFALKEPGAVAEYEYSRVSSPTRKSLETCMAELEEGRFALATSSGCAAMQLVLQLLGPGDLILAEEDLYGGSLRLLEQAKKSQGLQVQTTDFSKEQTLTKLLAQKPKMLWIESPSNPLLKVIDIQALALKKPADCLLVVDNTFASPFFQKPLKLGADLVLHSATKYIGGHSDCLAGLIVFKREDLKEPLFFLSKSIGPVLSPFDSYLLLRSLKTLSLRMERHEQNAFQVAEFLNRHEKVDRVLYPGLSTHPGHAIARKQMSGFSGVISFFLKESQDQRLDGESDRESPLRSNRGASDHRSNRERDRSRAFSFLKNLKIWTLAESLGAVESLAEQPLSMTHGPYSHPLITENLIRLSVGIEAAEDLISDLSQSFDKI